MIKTILLITFFIFSFLSKALSSPIVSGISSNEINIDTNFKGAQILLFGAKGDSGNIIIAVRGPKKDFIVSKKEKLLGVWYSGSRKVFTNSYSFYSLFSTIADDDKSSLEAVNKLLLDLELGKNNLQFNSTQVTPNDDEFRVQLIEKLEKNKLYSSSAKKIEFLNETLFKVMLNFPKNIARGIYSVEIYLIDDGNLQSFQSIPIYVNQVGFSARVLDFAQEQSFLYGFLTIAIAFIVGFIANYLFIRFVGK